MPHSRLLPARSAGRWVAGGGRRWQSQGQMKKVMLVCLLPLGACAAMMNTGPFLVPISSKPPGATVTYRGADVGVTPCTIKMQKQCTKLTLTLPEHHQQIVDVGTVAGGSGGWLLVGLLMWGPFEILIDVLDGLKKPNEDPVLVEVSPLSGPAPTEWKRPPPRRRGKRAD